MNINKIDIGMLLVFTQNIIYFLYLYTRNYTFLAIFFLLILPLLFFVKFKLKYTPYYYIFGIIFLSFGIWGLFSQQYEFYITWYNLLYCITALLAAYFFINSSYGLLISKVSFYLYSIFLLYFIFKFGADGEAYNEILEGSSRNYLSAISIFLTINIYIQIKYRNLPITLLPALVNFILCSLLFGRSGIALSFIILLFTTYIKNFKIFLILLGLTSISISLYMNSILNLLSERSNFVLGLESDRSIFRQEYLSNIFNSYDFLVGRKITECCTYIQSFGNPHNSFIMGHLRYGIFHTIVSLSILVFVFVKNDFVMLFFVLIIFSRYFLDQLGLFAFFDFVLFSVIFILIQKTDSRVVA